MQVLFQGTSYKYPQHGEIRELFRPEFFLFSDSRENCLAGHRVGGGNKNKMPQIFQSE